MKVHRFFSTTALLALAAVALLTGCRSTSPEPEAKKAETLTSDDRQAAEGFAREKGEVMLKAMQGGDYDAFVSPLSAAAREKYGKEYFDQLHGQLGKVVAMEYVTSLSSPLFNNYIWKVRCERTGVGEEDKGKTIAFDLLFILSVGKLDAAYTVFGFRFF